MRATAAIVILLLVAGTVGCRKAAARDGELLPGRSRPLLEHDWAHPRDLQFGANRFEPPDPQSAQVLTSAGVRANVIHAVDDRVVQIVAAVPAGRAFEQADEAGASELLSGLLTRQVEDRLGRGFTGRFQIEQDFDLIRVSLQMLADDWRQGLSALIGGLRELSLDAAAIEAYRTGPGYARQTRGLGGAGFRPAIELARLAGDHPVAPPRPGLTVPATCGRQLRSPQCASRLGGSGNRRRRVACGGTA